MFILYSQRRAGPLVEPMVVFIHYPTSSRVFPLRAAFAFALHNGGLKISDNAWFYINFLSLGVCDKTKTVILIT